MWEKSVMSRVHSEASSKEPSERFVWVSEPLWVELLLLLYSWRQGWSPGQFQILLCKEGWPTIPDLPASISQWLHCRHQPSSGFMWYWGMNPWYQDTLLTELFLQSRWDPHWSFICTKGILFYLHDIMTCLFGASSESYTHYEVVSLLISFFHHMTDIV